ncbi:MAG: hypothetical protein KDA90_06060 [Planctomycetaceae bacterium]|nr:hypothetical protein [Planctomycetaceae bacterium]
MRYSICLTFLCSAALVGCSGGTSEKLPQVAPTKVKVMQKGSPVEGATVTFHGPGENAKMAFGLTDASGTCELTTFKNGDGVVPGKNAVTVSKIDAGEANASGVMPKPKELLPKKYQDLGTSPLVFDVTDGQNEFTIEIE